MIFPHFPYEIGHFGHIFCQEHSESPSVNSMMFDRRPRLRLGCWVTHGQFKRVFFGPSMLEGNALLDATKNVVIYIYVCVCYM